MKYLLLLAITLFGLIAFINLENNIAETHKVNAEVIYPKIRIWTAPSLGEEPAFNSPSFQWPSTKKAKYSIRISSSTDFSNDLIEKDGILYAVFNPHKRLNPGIWYWQYKVNDEKWNKTDSFIIKSSTRIFETPEVKTLLTVVPSSHPRILANKFVLNPFRLRAKD